MRRTWMMMTALLFALVCCTLPSACAAATAKVKSFDAVWLPYPSSRMDIHYTYEAQWTTPGLVCSREVYWYENSLPRTLLSQDTHYASPVDVSGDVWDTFHSEGPGSYYKIKVDVTDGVTIYASDAKVDSIWY